MSCLFQLCSLQPETCWALGIFSPITIRHGQAGPRPLGSEPRARLWHLLDTVLQNPLLCPLAWPPACSGLASHPQVVPTQPGDARDPQGGGWILNSMLPGKLSWKKSGRTAQAVRMEREVAVTTEMPAWHLDLGFVFPKWMNSAPSQLSLYAGPSDGDSGWSSQ